MLRCLFIFVCRTINEHKWHHTHASVIFHFLLFYFFGGYIDWTIIYLFEIPHFLLFVLVFKRVFVYNVLFEPCVGTYSLQQVFERKVKIERQK